MKKIFAWVVAIVVLLAVVAELGVRWYIKEQVKAQFSVSATAESSGAAGSSGAAEPQEASVALGASPVLFGLLRQQLPYIKLDAPSTITISYPSGDQSQPVVEGNPAMNLEAHRIKMGPGGEQDIRLGSFRMTTTVPSELMLAEASASMNAAQQGEGVNSLIAEFLRVTDIRTNEADQTLEFELGGGVATMVMSPQVVDGEMTMKAADVQLLGFSLPASIRDSVAQGLADQATEEALGMGANVRVVEAKVTAEGLQTTLEGTDVALSELG